VANINYKIGGKYDPSGINNAKNGINSLGDTAKTVQNVLKGFLALKAVQIGKDLVMDSMNAFAAQQKAISSLTVAIGNNANMTSSSLRNIIDYTRQLSGVTIFSDQELQTQATLLTAMGLNEEQIRKTLKAATELSSAGIGTLEGNVKNLGKTFGGLTGELGESIPALKSLTKEQLIHGDAIDLVSEKYNGFAENLRTSTMSGQISGLTNSLTDLKEAIGQAFQPLTSPFITFITTIIDKWTDAINKYSEYDLLMRKGGLRTLQEEKRFVELEIEKTQTAQKADVKAANFPDFNNWLKQARFNQPEKYNKYDNDSLKNYAIEYSKMVQEVANRTEPTLKALRETLITLNTSIAEQEKKEIKPLSNNGIATTPPSLGKGLTLPDDFFVIDYGKLKLDLPAIEFNNSVEYALPTLYDGGQAPKDIGMSKIGGVDDILNSISAPFENLTYMVEGLTGPLAPLIQGFTSMGSVMQILSPLQTIFQSILETIAPVVDSLLAPLIGILKIVGRVIGALIIPALKFLEPVIELISMGFILLYNFAIKPLANSIIWVISALYNTISTVVNSIIGALNHIPFVNISWRMSKMDAQSMYLKDIDEGSLTEAGSSSDGSSGSNSSYTGTRDITVNIFYSNSFVSGDARQIALAIQEELKLANALTGA